jgi:peptidoglycan/xylan/chitin deacetylase (PgdA/CDA1 family)
MGPERLKETALGSNHAVRRIGRWMRNSRPVVRAVAGLHLGGPVILRYHSVSDDPSWRGGYMQESLVVSPGVFDRQLAALKRRHRLTSVDDIVDRMRAGRSIDSRAVAVTFDDGYEDNHRVVFPILKKHGASATFYVTTGAVGDEDILWTVRLRRSIRTCGRDRLPLTFLGPHPLDVSTDEAKEAAVKMLTGIVKRCKREEIEEILREVHEAAGTGQAAFDRRTMMNWEEIRELHRAGMSIGAHTVSHFNLPSLDTSDVAREVIASKKELEDKLETEITGGEDSGNGRVPLGRHVARGACVVEVLRVLRPEARRGAEARGHPAASRRHRVLEVQAPERGCGGEDKRGAAGRERFPRGRRSASAARRARLGSRERES